MKLTVNPDSFYINSTYYSIRGHVMSPEEFYITAPFSPAPAHIVGVITIPPPAQKPHPPQSRSCHRRASRPTKAAVANTTHQIWDPLRHQTRPPRPVFARGANCSASSKA